MGTTLADHLLALLFISYGFNSGLDLVPLMSCGVIKQNLTYFQEYAPVQHLNLPEMQLNINPVVTYSDMFAQVYNQCLVQFHFPIYCGIKENQCYNIKILTAYLIKYIL